MGLHSAASAALDPDKAPVAKISAATGVAMIEKVAQWFDISVTVPELIQLLTLAFLTLQVAWLVWRFFDKARARWKGDRYEHE